MGAFRPIFKCAVAVFALWCAQSAPAAGQAADLDALMAELANPETRNWEQVERRIRTEWSKSGSPAMDLLLQRGQEALEAEEYNVALEHLTALTDHAPDFAEGWHLRATALFHKRLYGPAMADLRRTLALNPQHFGALTGLAVILDDVGMSAQALDVWRMVETLHPHRPELQEAIRRLELETGGATL